MWVVGIGNVNRSSSKRKTLIMLVIYPITAT